MKPVSVHGSLFYNEDCRNGAREHIPANSVDLIITDPPYGINGNSLHVHYNRDENGVIPGYTDIPPEEYGEFSREWIREAERILRPGGSLYIVSGYTNLYHVLHALRETSLREINHIIWKYSFGVFTSTKYVSSHYHLLFYEKPGRKRTFNTESRFGLLEKGRDGRSENYRDRLDVWEIPREYKPGKRKNKNELPEALLVKMIQYSSSEGDLVCDFFLGGFSTAKVAIGMNRRALGFEISEEAFREKIPEIRALIPGYLLQDLPRPIPALKGNRRARWTENEVSLLRKRFDELTCSGKTRRETLAILQVEFQRGYWGIEKALKNLNRDESGQ
ncbi:MAG: site-specific DNA-methyltransferase [Methanoregulaceae archaeon]